MNSNELEHIKYMPTIKGGLHESIFKSYNTLTHVKKMLKRGDSNECILEIIEFLEYPKSPINKWSKWC